jgi:hypothetical protein
MATTDRVSSPDARRQDTGTGAVQEVWAPADRAEVNPLVALAATPADAEAIARVDAMVASDPAQWAGYAWEDGE